MISIQLNLRLRDGVPYAIDFCNPAPDAELTSVGQENFEWVVEAAANFAIEKAQASGRWKRQSYLGRICKKKC